MSMMVNPHTFALPLPPWSGPPGMISSSFTDRASGSGALNVSYPANQADDILVIQVLSLSAAGTAHTISTPSGFTQIDQNQLITESYYRHAVFYKRLSGSDSGSIALTTSIGTPPSAHTFVALISLWRGCVASGTPYEGLATNTGQNINMAGSSVTTTGIDRRVVNFAVCDDNTLATAGGSFVEEAEYLTSDGPDGSVKIYDLAAPSAGAYGAATHTLASSERWQVTSLALVPA